MAAKLGVTGLGTYATAVAVYGVISVMGVAGATLFLIRELATDRSRTSSYVVHLSALGVGSSLILTGVTEILIRHVGYSASVQASLAVILLSILPKTLNSIQESVFVVYGRTEYETITTFVSSVLYLAVSVYLLTHGYGVESVLVAYVIFEYVVTGVYYVLIERTIARLRWRLEWALARRLLREVRPYAASSALAALFIRPEIVILSLLSTSQQVGYYSAAVRVSEIWLFVPEVFLNNVYPLMARAHQEGIRRFEEVQAKAIKYCMAYSLPLTAGMLALAGPIIETLFGSRFAAARTELQLLALNLTFFTLMEVFWRSVSARGRQSAVFRVQLAVSIVRLSVGTGLIALLASLGAAISMAMSAVFQAGLLARLAGRTGVAPPVVSVSWRLGLAAATMGGAAWLLNQWLTIWVVIPVAGAVYVVAAVALRALPREDIRSLRTLLPTRPRFIE